MPAVRATDDEAWKMAAFVAAGTAGLREKATGDAVAGKAVYEGKGGVSVAPSGGEQPGPGLERRGAARISQPH
jgi:hypothetical protein